MDAKHFLEFNCDLCNKSYKQESSLNNHLIKYHKLNKLKKQDYNESGGTYNERAKDNNEGMDTEDKQINEYIEEEQIMMDSIKEEKDDDILDSEDPQELGYVEYHPDFVDESLVDESVAVDTFNDSMGAVREDANTRENNKSINTKIKSETINETTPETRDYSRYSIYYERSPAGEYACKSCGMVYKSNFGIRYHCQTYVCGVGVKENPSYRKEYTYMYTKEGDGSLSCNKCETKYNSARGIHYHLKTTVCGDGVKEGRKPRINWKRFWTKEVNGSFKCAICSKSAFSCVQEIHQHLKRTKCGSGAKVKEFTLSHLSEKRVK